MVWLRMASISVLLQLHSLSSVELIAKGVAPPSHEQKAATFIQQWSYDYDKSTCSFLACSTLSANIV